MKEKKEKERESELLKEVADLKAVIATLMRQNENLQKRKHADSKKVVEIKKYLLNPDRSKIDLFDAAGDAGYIGKRAGARSAVSTIGSNGTYLVVKYSFREKGKAKFGKWWSIPNQKADELFALIASSNE